MSEKLYNKYNNQLFKWCITKTNDYNDAGDYKK